MQLSTLSIQNFRSIDLRSISFKSPITVIVGKNNAGKTTILEALYFCSNLMSFKSIKNDDLIKDANDFFKLSLNFSQNTINNNIFIEKSLKSSKCSYNNKKISKKALSSSFPCYSLVFGFNNILLNDSSYRRDFIDSGMFHVEPGSLDTLANFNKTVKQRNYLLKSKDTDNLDFWNQELVCLNSKLHSSRHNYFNLLNHEFNNIVSRLEKAMPGLYDEISTIKLSYKQGWAGNFEEALSDSLKKDYNLGYTSLGTHRSDIELLSKEKLVKESGSMSTLVLSCLVMYLAKIRVFHVKHGFKPVLLIDDLFFGIDDKNLDTVIKLLVYSNSNIVMTAPNIYKGILAEISNTNESISILNIGEG